MPFYLMLQTNILGDGPKAPYLNKQRVAMETKAEQEKEIERETDLVTQQQFSGRARKRTLVSYTLYIHIIFF